MKRSGPQPSRAHRATWPNIGLAGLLGLYPAGLYAGSAAIPGTLNHAGPAATRSTESSPTANLGGLPGGAYSERSEEEMLLFEVRLEGATLSDTFPGYPVKGAIFVPLGELCRLLGLAITTDPLTGRASGFIIKEARTFKLDLGSGTLEVEGKKSSLDRSQIELHRDDLYVDTRLLSQLLPIELKVDRLGSRINVIPREPLPAQAMALRERSRMAFGGSRADKHHYVPLDDPYRWAEWPMVDQTVRIGSSSASGAGSRTSLQSTTYASGDLLKMTSNLYIFADSQGSRSLRATLGRRDPDSRLLGPLGASEFQLGEVFDPGLDGVSFPNSGTGVFVTNLPLSSDIFGDKKTFRGDLPPGWQVELYQNGALAGFQGSRADGLYEFLNLPLQHGWNDFRMVFYGPGGERREESYHLDASQPQVSTGGFRYRLAAMRLHGDIGDQGQFVGQYGFSDHVSAFGAISRASLTDGSHFYSQGGVQGRWNLLSLQGSFTKQQDGGSAGQLALSTRLGSSLSLTFKHAELWQDFASPVFLPTNGPIRRRDELDAQGLLPSIEHPFFNVGLNAQRDTLLNGGEVLRLSPRFGGSAGGWFYSNFLTYQRLRLTGQEAVASSFGNLLLTRFFGGFAARGEATYSVGPIRHLQNVGAYLDLFKFQPWTLQAGVLRVVDARDNRLVVSANKAQGLVSIAFDGSWSSRSGWTAALTLRMGLAREPRSGHWAAQAQSAASFGGISALTYLDTNANGRPDAGEAPLSDIGFFVNGVNRPGGTDARGVNFLRNIPPDTRTKVLLSPSTLPDPLMKQEGDGFSFLARPGHIVQAEVPVVQTGDINGTVFQKPNRTALPGITLELLDATGKVVASMRTAYDGYYEFSDLQPAIYQLRIKAEDLTRRHLMLPEPKKILLQGEVPEANGVDWNLEPEPEIQPK